MLRPLALIAVLLTGADHWTTYLCLSGPIEGWQVNEANPMANWLFHVAGLLPGLALDSVISVMAVLFLLTTGALSKRTRAGLLSAIALFTGYAVVNNLQAISAMGLWPVLVAQG